MFIVNVLQLGKSYDEYASSTLYAFDTKEKAERKKIEVMIKYISKKRQTVIKLLNHFPIFTFHKQRPNCSSN